MFTVLINQNGDVETVRMLQKSNNSQLNTILTDLIKTWKYKPALKNSAARQGMEDRSPAI